MKTRRGVWIALRDGFWFVGIQSGYYNQPLAKEEAIERARQLRRQRLAASESATPIKVFGEDDQLIEQIA